MSTRKKRRGHFCRLCGRIRANEKFSGKGHAWHICNECARKPKDERDRILNTEEIVGFMWQSNISEKNMERLKELANSPNERVVQLATVVLEIARVKPHKRKRLSFLARNHSPLLHKLEQTGLIDDRGESWLKDVDMDEEIEDAGMYDAGVDYVDDLGFGRIRCR